MKRFTPPSLLLTLLVAAACAPSEPESTPDTEPPAEEAPVAQAPGVVDVTAVGLTFQAPDEIPSGWTTFRFQNASAMTHFAVVERMPDGVGVQEQQEVVAPIFQEGMDLLAAGEADLATEKFGEIPEWFGEIVFTGGPGLTAPGHTSQATIQLEPGTYLLECYVKTDGVFHSFNPEPGVYGMVHELHVTDAMSQGQEPQASMEITLSTESGMEVEGTPSVGRQTVAVHFESQTVHENFAGHDVHLARLPADADLEALEAWMDWRQPQGLQTPAPAEFLGGLSEMPAGSTGYFTVDLEPGSYAWISEVPGGREKGLLQTFTVEGGGP